MKRFTVAVVLIALVLGALPAVAAIVEPPAINMPAGGKVVTEINLGDNDVLGIVKQSIPALADVIKEVAPSVTGAAGASANADIANSISFDELSQAIAGVKDIRVLVACYPNTMTAERFLSEFTAGVGKLGRFSKTATDLKFFPGSVGLFSAPDNGGIVGFAYDPKGHTAYALRVVGGLDMPKLIHWSGQISSQIGKFFMGRAVESFGTPPSDQAAPGTAAPQPPVEAK